jgi:hypothetical protein
MAPAVNDSHFKIPAGNLHGYINNNHAIGYCHAQFFSHSAVAVALKTAFPGISWRLFLTTFFCNLLPGLDVISFKLDIAYESIWRHRDISHPFVFVGAVALFFLLSQLA